MTETLATAKVNVNSCMEPVTLTVADLASIKTLLEASCTRGAFRAAEMTQVGRLYDKLATFLQQHELQSETQPVQGEINA